MSLCVYHETVQASAVCRDCQQAICHTCLEYGEGGACGMCVEMRKANRYAHAEMVRRVPAAAPTRLNACPRHPEREADAACSHCRKAVCASCLNLYDLCTSCRELPSCARHEGLVAADRCVSCKAPYCASCLDRSGRCEVCRLQAAPRSQAQAKPRPKPDVPACKAHPDQPATSACQNCQKACCPYCLDLYDLCAACRELPSCSRHESLVAADRCAGCKMPYCQACLGGTDLCDRCRAQGGKARRQAEPAKKVTDPLRKPEPPIHPEAMPRRPATTRKLQPGYRPEPFGDRLKKLPKPVYAALALIAIGLLVLLWPKAAMSPEVAKVHLRAHMSQVEQAAVSIQRRTGRLPETSEAIVEEMKGNGVVLEELALPLKLVVNTTPVEPGEIAFRQIGDSYEIRALDLQGKPLILDKMPGPEQH